MVNWHELKPAPGSKRSKKRVGRGHGSGHGTTAGRGTKGQKARAGGNLHPRFEGGQLPLVQRLPHKRGFTNRFRVEYEVVNVSELNRFEANAQITPEILAEARLTRSRRPVKILGDGALSKALLVKAHKFSASAKQKIQEAGGRVEELAP